MRKRAKKVKLTKAEQIAAEISKWQRTQERALIMERKAATLLKRSAVELARLHKRQARQAVLDRDTRGTDAPAARLAVAVRTDGTEELVPVIDRVADFVTLGQAAQAAVDKVIADQAEPAGVRFGPDEAVKRPTDVAPPKPKRQRKPKPSGLAESSADLASALIQAPQPTPEARQARMAALGFHRTSKRK